MLYVGLDRPQKNLDAAIAGVGRTAFSRSGGGRFLLVGVQESAHQRLRAVGLANGTPTEVRGRCTDDELVELYAGAECLIVPSLEEGFGLPVVEALAAGVPVCCSGRSALVEAAHGTAQLFDPTDVTDIASTVDRTIGMARDGTWAERAHRFRESVRLPTAADMAVAIVDVLDGRR